LFAKVGTSDGSDASRNFCHWYTPVDHFLREWFEC
jgi:hypothetical protein